MLIRLRDRDDLILYTVTSDATLRIFLPVLDAPQHLQLHASLDIYSALPFSVASEVTGSNIFWLSRDVMSKALASALTESGPTTEDGRHKRVREIQDENWDLFLRVLSDGSLVLQAVAVRIPNELIRRILTSCIPRTLTDDPLHSSNSLLCCSLPPLLFRNLRVIYTYYQILLCPEPSLLSRRLQLCHIRYLLYLSSMLVERDSPLVHEVT